MAHLTNNDLTAEERILWNRVIELWKCSLNRDLNSINKAIHPNYIGWDNNSLVPHDRNDVIQSLSDKAVKLIEYKLHPLTISIYDKHVGIVNYRYNANIGDKQNNIRALKGRWTEIYLRKNDDWILIGVHGETEPLKVISTAKIY